jgi:bacterioferritin-associated ferredoxin
MLVCLCKGVSDRKIRWLVQNGAKTPREVMASCHAGSDCGACVATVRDTVNEAIAETACTSDSEGQGPTGGAVGVRRA